MFGGRSSLLVSIALWICFLRFWMAADVIFCSQVKVDLARSFRTRNSTAKKVVEARGSRFAEMMFSFRLRRLFQGSERIKLAFLTSAWHDHYSLLVPWNYFDNVLFSFSRS